MPRLTGKWKEFYRSLYKHLKEGGYSGQEPPQFVARRITLKLMKTVEDPDTIDVRQFDSRNPFESLEKILTQRTSVEQRMAPTKYGITPEEMEYLENKTLWDWYLEHLDKNPQLKKYETIRRLHFMLRKRMSEENPHS